MKNQDWLNARIYSDDKIVLAHKVLDEVRAGSNLSEAIRRNPLPDGGYLGKHVLIAAYRHLVKSGDWAPDLDLLARIRMKPVRTLSGVTTVTVLTKPYSCPGQCIFCPTDIRMPKSYVPDEPGARRALEHDFDPYSQVTARIEALQAIGHPVDKVELLILGGTWNAYPRDYQEWFILRCFDALNGIQSATLEEAFSLNETTRLRNVGLAVETRPDNINTGELAWLRYLGVTKVQMGAQSLDDCILKRNKRGHSVAQTHQAVALLRSAGFKIVLHWMPNLLGATYESDKQDFYRLWDDFCPDEIKIYPTQLLHETKLYEYWQRGEYKPYTTGELIDLIADIKPSIPRYCRVNRVVRDIPSTYVVEGNKRTSLRQDIHKEMRRRGTRCQCVRCREVRSQGVDANTMQSADLVYKTRATEEQFLSYVTTDDHLAGFIRLSLPGENSPDSGIPELSDAAIIRELHVYGQSLQVGEEQNGAAQHTGLGRRLINKAEAIAHDRDYKRIAVISAVGTRSYYLRLGYMRGIYYLFKQLN